MKKILKRPFDENHPIFNSDLPLSLKRVLAARDITNTEELASSLKNLLPFQQMKNCEQAANLLAEAIAEQKRILIVGDFDADGATSTAVAMTALRAFGAKHVDYLVPNRFEYGYGLTPEIVHVAKNKSPDWIITVDNGIASVDGVLEAKKLGIQVLVTDHHLPAQQLPKADCIVNPNQPGCEFASKSIAGVGVIFYVMLALRHVLRSRNWFQQQNILEPNMAQYLDLVALGTVADVVALDKNNRILVQQGIIRIRKGQCRPGILALLKITNRSYENLVATDLGFVIAPRLNAAGRLDDMSLGIECLLATSLETALPQAQELDSLNRERREIEIGMQQQALQIIERMQLLNESELPLGLCIYEETWHQGVIGIVASRIKDRFHRPVIAFAKVNEHELKGSARSVAGVHIRDVLDTIATKYPNLITKFGGHAMAAGLSLPEQNFEKFKAIFESEINNFLTKEQVQGVIFTDGELLPEEYNFSLAEWIFSSVPWGQGFPIPIFEGEFEVLEQRLVGTKHLKMTLLPAQYARPLDAIAFFVDNEKWPNERCSRIRAVFRLEISEYQQLRKLQLLIEHFEPSYI